MGGKVNGDLERNITRIGDLLQFAFNPEVFSGKSGELIGQFSLEDYFSKLLAFLAKQYSIPALLIRKQEQFDGTKLSVLATYGIDRAEAEALTSVTTSSGLAQYLSRTREAYYCKTIASDPHIEEKQKEFAASKGLKSAIYSPVLEESQLVAFVAFFKKDVAAFTPEEIISLTDFLCKVIPVIFSWAERLDRTGNQILKQYRESSETLSSLLISFHSAKGHLEDTPWLIEKAIVDVRQCDPINPKNQRFILEELEIARDRTKTIKELVLGALEEQKKSSRIDDLMALIKDQTALLPFSQHRIELKYKDGSQISLQGNERQLKHLFFNIVHNSYQAILQAQEETLISGGLIEISAEDDANSGIVTIRVTDNGIGIPDENKSRIHEKRFTTWPGGRGTGIGLALCKEIVDQHMGKSFEIDSTHRKGTTVTIKLPKSLSK